MISQELAAGRTLRPLIRLPTHSPAHSPAHSPTQRSSQCIDALMNRFTLGREAVL